MREAGRDAAVEAALCAELDAATGASRVYDAALVAHFARWPGLPEEGEARWFVESLATFC